MTEALHSLLEEHNLRCHLLTCLGKLLCPLGRRGLVGNRLVIGLHHALLLLHKPMRDLELRVELLVRTFTTPAPVGEDPLLLLGGIVVELCGDLFVIEQFLQVRDLRLVRLLLFSKPILALLFPRIDVSDARLLILVESTEHPQRRLQHSFARKVLGGCHDVLALGRCSFLGCVVLRRRIELEEACSRRGRERLELVKLIIELMPG
mmetsp:Transcript_56831/g.122899  ORF Transcript_56831/g.122899 Transcript_56831/m.122899 type:complete len:206 (-) Transcript_56831:209-826(-)